MAHAFGIALIKRARLKRKLETAVQKERKDFEEAQKKYKETSERQAFLSRKGANDPNVNLDTFERYRDIDGLFTGSLTIKSSSCGLLVDVVIPTRLQMEESEDLPAALPRYNAKGERSEKAISIRERQDNYVHHLMSVTVAILQEAFRASLADEVVVNVRVHGYSESEEKIGQAVFDHGKSKTRGIAKRRPIWRRPRDSWKANP